MTDHAKRQEYLRLNDSEGYSNKIAVSLVMCALFVPSVVSILFWG